MYRLGSRGKQEADDTGQVGTRLSRWAQDIAACRSAGERTSVLAMGSTDAAAGKLKVKEPSNRDLMNTLKSIQNQLKTVGD